MNVETVKATTADGTEIRITATCDEEEKHVTFRCGKTRVEAGVVGTYRDGAYDIDVEAYSVNHDGPSAIVVEGLDQWGAAEFSDACDGYGVSQIVSRVFDLADRTLEEDVESIVWKTIFA
jgi:hypothetical protein